MRFHGTVLLCLATLSSAAVAADKPATSLSKLYQSYEDAGHSALSMPEYDQAVRFTAVVLEQSTSMADTALTSATDGDGEVEYARLSSEDGKLAALPPGTAFTATCTVGFTSGTDYLNLTDCVVE
ncbi:hypothetical protein GLA29479_4166 [Lysobacter antibioticus]|uniref:hypothetical protein n=1 Tax=Lysobacter antibioticus TaxID=84531 RepID=UPI000722E71C|nr:hypothetical protein [Lysobacter antibioticus]ALN65012.1 hypothetical protein GLA29479_4166 [Lysobacter antibioticus]